MIIEIARLSGQARVDWNRPAKDQITRFVNELRAALAQL
jgi:hypothetical protein